jgi:hypothetical protein
VVCGRLAVSVVTVLLRRDASSGAVNLSRVVAILAVRQIVGEPAGETREPSFFFPCSSRLLEVLPRQQVHHAKARHKGPHFRTRKVLDLFPVARQLRTLAKKAPPRTQNARPPVLNDMSTPLHTRGTRPSSDFQVWHFHSLSAHDARCSIRLGEFLQVAGELAQLRSMMEGVALFSSSCSISKLLAEGLALQ